MTGEGTLFADVANLEPSARGTETLQARGGRGENQSSNFFHRRRWKGRGRVSAPSRAKVKRWGRAINLGSFRAVGTYPIDRSQRGKQRTGAYRVTDYQTGGELTQKKGITSMKLYVKRRMRGEKGKRPKGKIQFLQIRDPPLERGKGGDIPIIKLSERFTVQRSVMVAEGEHRDQKENKGE